MKSAYLISLIIPAALILGCTGPSKSDDENLFHPAEDKAHIDAFVNRQAGSNTRQDATMYTAHFTGPCLNSLGKAKLDLLLQCPECASVTDIYFPHAIDTDEHRHAVADYLTHHGWKSSQFALMSGSNPDGSYTMAKQSLADLDKFNGASAEGDSSASSIGMGSTSGGK